MTNFITDGEDTKNAISSVLIILISTAIAAYFVIIIRNLIVKYCTGVSKIATANTHTNETAVNINEANRDSEMGTSVKNFES